MSISSSSSSSAPHPAPTSSNDGLARLERAHLPPALRAELVEVYAQLRKSVQGLQYPLNELLSQAIEQAYPFADASIVLAAGVCEREDEVLRQRRIYLAAALEMLRIALSVHSTLLAQSPDGLPMAGADLQHMEQNKSLIGSVILVGDYCFSHSAHMAAQTDNPEVVALFAQALKELSEEHLRHVFTSKTTRVAMHEILFRAGVETAARLADLSPRALSQNLSMSNQLAQAMDSDSVPELPRHQQIDVPAFQYERWQSLIPWLLDVRDRP